MYCLLVLVCLALSVQAQLGAAPPAPAQSAEELHPPPPVLRKPLFIVHDPSLRISERGKSEGELPLPEAEGASPAVLSPQRTDVKSTTTPWRSAPRYPPAHAAHGPRAPYTPPRYRGTIPPTQRV